MFGSYLDPPAKNVRLKQERDLLKRVAAFFAADQ